MSVLIFRALSLYGIYVRGILSWFPQFGVLLTDLRFRVGLIDIPSSLASKDFLAISLTMMS